MQWVGIQCIHRQILNGNLLTEISHNGIFQYPTRPEVGEGGGFLDFRLQRATGRRHSSGSLNRKLHPECSSKFSVSRQLTGGDVSLICWNILFDSHLF
jgi:hypothetical protein